MKHLMYLLVFVSVMMPLTGCNKERDDDYNPKTPHDGVFSYVFEDVRYNQFDSPKGHGCSAYAIINSTRDTLIINGFVSDNNKPRCTFPRLVFVISLDKITPDNELYLEGDEISVMTADYNYMKGYNAKIFFDSPIDIDRIPYYVSGSFEAVVFGGRVTLSDGLFKMWAQEAPEYYFNHCSGKSIPCYSHLKF